MATPGQLIDEIVRLTGFSRSSVDQTDRLLKKAGLRTEGGRGPAAARVTPVDAARLLIAMVVVQGRDATPDEVVRLYSSTVTSHFNAWQQVYRDNVNEPLVDEAYPLSPLPGLAALPVDHSFIDAVGALIEAGGDPAVAEHWWRVEQAEINASAPGAEAVIAIPIGHGDQASSRNLVRYERSSKATVQWRAPHEYTFSWIVRIRGDALLNLGAVVGMLGSPK